LTAAPIATILIGHLSIAMDQSPDAVAKPAAAKWLQWKPGQSGNPSGRNGSKRAALMAALLGDYARSHDGQEPSALDMVRILQLADLSLRSTRRGISHEDMVRTCRMMDRLCTRLSIKPPVAPSPPTPADWLAGRAAAAASASEAPSDSPAAPISHQRPAAQAGSGIHGARVVGAITGTKA